MAITFKSREGQLYEVPEENAQQAISEGWSPAAPEEIAAYDQRKHFQGREAEAGGLALARGFSFGLSDLALGPHGAGVYSGDELQGLRDTEGLEGANIIGETVGTVLPAILSGGSSLLATGAKATAAGAAAVAERAAAQGVQTLIGSGAQSLAGRVAQKVIPQAAGGAIGGGLWGAGRAVSEYGMDETPELTAERLLAHISDGVKFGAGAGAVGASIEGLLGAASKRIRRAATGRPVIAEAVPEGAPPQVAANSERAAKMRAEEASAADRGVDLGDVDLDAVDDTGELGGLVGAGLSAIGRGTKWATDVIEGVGEREGKTLLNTLRRIGVDVPDSPEMVRRGFDFRMSENSALRKRGLEKIAPEMLTSDPRFKSVIEDTGNARPLSERITEFVQAKAVEGAQLKNQVVDQLDQLAQPEERWFGPAVATRLRNEVIDPLAKGPTSGRALARQLEEQAAELEARGMMTFREAEEFVTKLDDEVFKASGNSDRPAAKAWTKTRFIIKQETRDQLKNVAERIGQPELYAAYREGSLQYGALKTMHAGAVKRLLNAKDSNNLISLGDRLTGNLGATLGGIGGAIAAPFSLPLAAALGVSGILLNKWARERLPFKMALWLKQADRPGPEAILAKGFHKQVSKTLEEETIQFSGARARQVATAQEAEAAAAAGLVDPLAAKSAVDPTGVTSIPGGPLTPPPEPPQSVFGKFSPVLSEAAAESPAALFATHALLSTVSPEYVEQMEKAGFADMTPEEDSEAFEKAVQLQAVGQEVGKHQKKLADEAAMFASGRRGSSERVQPMNAAQMREQLDDLVSLVTHPETLGERVDPGGTLAGLAPAVGGAVSGTVQRAAEVLQQVAPTPPPESTVKTYGSEWSPSRDQIAKYARVARAVMRPMSLMEDMRRGAVSVEAVEAVRFVYPNLLERMGQAYIEAATETGARFTYQQRILLSALIGQPMDPSLDPAAGASYQQTSQAAAARAANQTKPTGQRVKIPNSQTASQRIESRG